MATLQAPTGQFLLLEMEPGLHPAHVAVLVHMFVSMAQVQSCSDLAFMPLEFLEDRILLRLEPDDIPREYRSRSVYNAIRQHHRRTLQPQLPGVGV